MDIHLLWSKILQILHLSFHVFLSVIEEPAFFPALPHAFLGIVRLWPLTPHHAWWFPTYVFIYAICHLDVHRLLLKSYVNLTITIFSFFKTLFCSPKTIIQWKVLTEEVNKTGWHTPLPLCAIQPRFPCDTCPEKAKECSALLRRARKSFPRAGLFFLMFKKVNTFRITRTDCMG